MMCELATDMQENKLLDSRMISVCQLPCLHVQTTSALLPLVRRRPTEYMLESALLVAQQRGATIIAQIRGGSD